DEQQPRPERVAAFAAGEGLALGAQDDVAGGPLEHEFLRVLERGKEQRADEPSSGTDERGVPDGAAEQLQLERRALRAPDLGEAAEATSLLGDASSYRGVHRSGAGEDRYDVTAGDGACASCPS